MIQNINIDNVEVKKSYYASGALFAETPYVNGKEHGIEKAYHESGTLEREIPYVNGERHGILKSYYETGDIYIARLHMRMERYTE